MRIATTAVINTLQGGVDYSNGGFYWDGTDILYIPSAQKNRYASQGVYVPISQEAGVCIFENNSYIYLEKKNGCATEAVYKSIWYKVDGIKLTTHVEAEEKHKYTVTTAHGRSIFYLSNNDIEFYHLNGNPQPKKINKNEQNLYFYHGFYGF